MVFACYYHNNHVPVVGTTGYVRNAGSIHLCNHASFREALISTSCRTRLSLRVLSSIGSWKLQSAAFVLCCPDNRISLMGQRNPKWVVF
jgi:hypothetical protein